MSDEAADLVSQAKIIHRLRRLRRVGLRLNSVKSARSVDDLFFRFPNSCPGLPNRRVKFP